MNPLLQYPAVETAATRGAKPTCVGSPHPTHRGWGESPQGDLVPFVAANLFAIPPALQSRRI
jgi:hypothetical protein